MYFAEKILKSANNAHFWPKTGHSGQYSGLYKLPMLFTMFECSPLCCGMITVNLMVYALISVATPFLLMGGVSVVAKGEFLLIFCKCSDQAENHMMDPQDN